MKKANMISRLVLKTLDDIELVERFGEDVSLYLEEFKRRVKESKDEGVSKTFSTFANTLEYLKNLVQFALKEIKQ